MTTTNPEGWESDVRPVIKSPADLVIYEMHHRDFSIHESSGLVNKGKFLALTEQKAIDHLKALGVNAIHILPSYDYASVDETRLNEPQYNWGYDPVNYNVPEGSYSTDPYTPATRIKEFKQMVQALHNAGIRVILDVVYNHTWDINGSNFQRTYPDYFYRKTADGQYSNGSGCGNETASEQEMMRKYMVESVKYWINEYHIDGFRFDLMGVHDIETMNQIRKAVDEIDPTIYIYGEGWSAGSCAYPTEKLGLKANIQQMPGIGAFSDEIRDALRGPFNDDHKAAFLACKPDNEESIKFGIAGAIEHPQLDYSKVNYSTKPWATEPTQMISYVSCHDDMCLVDRLKSSIPGISMDELIRLNQLAQTAVFTSQGVPFMLSGEEMLRDKKGVHNSYNSPDSINQLDWDNMKRYPQVLEYYQKLIQLRKNHPAFRLGSADLVRKHLEFLDAPKNVVAFRLKNYAGRDDWRDIIVVLNANKTPQSVNIPKGKYTIVALGGVINEQGMGNMNGDKATALPQSALIIHN
jgi:pullulanase